MIILLRISILAISYLYFFRQSFIAELAISFIPYIIWFCILALFIETWLIIHESKRRRKYKWIRIFFTILVTILTIWIWTLYSSEFFWFYNQNDKSIRLNNKWIKVFYANIYYKNVDYHSLQQKIEEENPDIVVMVEFSDAHEDEMKDYFQENYPYMNRNSRSTMLAGDVVFSKIPLENITETHQVEAWNRNYSYMKILSDDYEDWVNLYVIHTAAPVSLKNFEMRNNQIGKLLSDFLKYHKEWEPTMIIWDFNLSPWSHYYKQLTKHRNMLNALSSPEIKISTVKIENLSWSDHRSFTFNLWVN